MSFTQASSSTSKELVFSQAYRHYFPSIEFGGYDTFLNAKGERVKSERRTNVVVVHRRANGSLDGAEHSFVLKIYYYPFFPSIRTGFQRSKAEREFRSLLYLEQEGLSAAAPVAYGSARSRLGLVKSCFIITDFVAGTINLGQWRTESARRPEHNRTQSALILEQIGALFRRLHDKRFFLFASKPKNILIRHASTPNPELFFIDVPYSRTVHWGPVARWAQARDLGMFLGNFYPYLSEGETAAFYQGYLPNPLGKSDATLHTEVDRVVRSTQHRTPLKALFYPLKRAFKSRV